GDLRVGTSHEKHFIEIEVHLGELAAEMIAVELYADSTNGNVPTVLRMTRRDDLTETKSWHTYTVEIPATRPASDYTPRIVSDYPAAKKPMEESHILWFR